MSFNKKNPSLINFQLFKGNKRIAALFFLMNNESVDNKIKYRTSRIGNKGDKRQVLHFYCRFFAKRKNILWMKLNLKKK